MAPRLPHIGFLQLRQLSEHSNDSTNASTNMNNTTDQIGQYSTALNGVNSLLDNFLKDALWWSLGALAILVLVMRLTERFKKHYRHVVSMSVPGEYHAYWARNNTQWWKIKKHILYAPFWNKRHNREIRLSSAINMGTIPSRFHTILLSAYLLSNIAYCAALDYSLSDKYAVVASLRGRSGTLAVCNIIPLVILAGRNNPLIPLLQISFDTYNLLHRWMGRIVVLEAVIHTLAWAYVKHAATGWSGVGSMIMSDPFIGWGMIATIGMIIIIIIAPSPIRHAFYETFLNVHIILALFSLIGVYVHLAVANLPQVPYMQATLLLWLAERLVRVLRLVYYNYARRDWTKASIEALPGDACRVTMHLPRYVDIKPGTHAYLRFASLKIWESHPFSIAWIVHHSNTPLAEKELESQVPQRITRALATTDVSFIIHAQTGLTKRLYDQAKLCSPRVLTLKAAFEGPYAGHHSLDSYGHVVLYAGSSGITHQIPYVKHLLQGRTDGTVATRKVLLVWIIREAEHLEWVRPWMDEILCMKGRRDILTIKLFITRPKNPREIISPSSTVQMLPGRPNVKQILQSEVKEQTGAMCVTVCGPGGLGDNVRDAVREVQADGHVDFIEESFTW